MSSIVKSYVESLILKYPYWNRTQGADHFFVTCHDVGLRATEGVSLLKKNSIRVVCSSRYDSEHIPHKDVALPQVQLPFALPASGNDFKDSNIWSQHSVVVTLNSMKFLDWKKFSLILRKDNVTQLKDILEGIISKEKFIELHKNTVKAQKHFYWNTPPRKHDAFHMVMYELWLRHYVIKYYCLHAKTSSIFPTSSMAEASMHSHTLPDSFDM